MQPIIYMIAISCSAVLTIFALGFFATAKLDRVSFLIMLALAIAVGFGIVFGVKKFWLRLGSAEVGLDTYKDEIDTFTKTKLKEIQKDVNLHKQSITAILRDANAASERLSKHGKSINDLVTHAQLAELSIQKTIENTTPPGLIRANEKIVSTDEGIAISFALLPDRTNYTLGDTTVIARIIENENSKILRMQKIGTAVYVYPDTKVGQIQLEGKAAGLVYRVPVRLPLMIEIMVTEPCKLLLMGTCSIKPKELEVKLPSE